MARPRHNSGLLHALALGALTWVAILGYAAWVFGYFG